MEFAATQLSAIASFLGDYGAALILAGMATYVATAYFAFLGQKTICLVNILRPDIEQLKRKFEGKPKELNHALLGMYAKNGVNSLGFLFGLIPLALVTLCIIVFSLAITGETTGMNSAFIPWINNLAAPDPSFVLPVALGLIYFVHSTLTLRFNPSRRNTSKRYFTRALPAFALIVSAFLPAGVAVYWITYAVLSVVQQYVVFQHVLSPATHA